MIKQHFIIKSFLGAGSQILVGTTKNCILAGTMELSFREVVLGHADEVNGDIICEKERAEERERKREREQLIKREFASP